MKKKTISFEFDFTSLQDKIKIAKKAVGDVKKELDKIQVVIKKV